MEEKKKVALVALRSGAFPSGVWLWINSRSVPEANRPTSRREVHVLTMLYPSGTRKMSLMCTFFSTPSQHSWTKALFYTHTRDPGPRGVLASFYDDDAGRWEKGRCLWVCIYVCTEITSIICCYQHDTWWRWCWLYCVATGESSGMKVRRLVFMLFLCCKREKSFVLSRYRNRCSSVALWKGCLSRET